MFIRQTLSKQNIKKNDGKRSIIEMSKKNQLSFKDHIKLAKHSKKKGLDYLCSAFDLESLIFLDKEINVKHIKIPSGEVFDLNTLITYQNQKKNFYVNWHGN